MGLIGETAIYLAVAVAIVPLMKRIGLGDVLGYLLAGVVIGPFLLAVVEDPEAILHFAEIGVVFMLFIIGMELKPARLRVFRKLIFGVGLTQVVLTSAVATAIALMLGLDWAPALVVGMALSLSSTAMVVQLLSERKELLSPHGRVAFGVLLFQDIAVIPMLGMIQLLGSGGATAGTRVYWIDGLIAVAAIGGTLLAGKWLLRPVLRGVATYGSQEVFTATALLLVLGAGLAMEAAGLSMGLGAFLAGVLVADSEYRHQLETDIAPFKGLLLGLFFMAVGMSADLGLLGERPGAVLGLALALMAGKAVLIGGLALAFGNPAPTARRVGLRLAQGGEFAFVLLAAAQPAGLVSRDLSDLVILAVTVSMAATPLVQLVEDRFTRTPEPEPRAFDEIPHREPEIILAGFGRFGQIIGRLLTAQHIPFTALESSASHVDFVRRFGSEIFYGDPSRLDLLRSARADHAKVFILAVDDVETSVAIARNVTRHFPHLALYARARNRRHAMELRALGATAIVRETLPASLELGEQVLLELGATEGEARRATTLFRDHDAQALDRQFAIRDDEEALIQSQRESTSELQLLFEMDREDEGTD